MTHEEELPNSRNDLRRKGMQNVRKPMGSKQSILSGNKLSLHVKAIETCILTLSSGFNLKLEKTFYVPIFSRSLIFVSRLVPFVYSFNFKDTSFKLFYNFNVLGMTSCLMVFIFLVYKMMSLIV